MGSEEEPHEPGLEHEHAEEDISEPEVCEVCGGMIAPGSERYGMVPDPTAGYAGRPEWDGRRPAVACSSKHMTELIRRAEQHAVIIPARAPGVRLPGGSLGTHRALRRGLADGLEGT
jgi:hypothetical protein